MATFLGPFSLDGMVRAVQRVRDRLLRATSALEQAQVPYAVIGGNAVAAWVARVDESAVRNTQDVDVLIRRADFDAVKKALEGAGFRYHHAASIDMFLDGPNAKARDAIHVVFAGETVRSGEPLPNPDVTESEMAGQYKILSLRALVQIKLTAFRDKDRTHLRDLLDVGLIDSSWGQYYPPELAARLQQLVNTPGG
ncbi:MAG TPA: nucleotidyltransferase family protein [Pirellulales bacterium]|jgi:hypothetical protein|nr:nucleotidyltransferase family protein [Pirellulales bacterium]